MSNPSVNRWGLNLFWYRFWYSDFLSNSNYAQDYAVNKLILLYIHFGILSHKNPFVNLYWYLKNFISINSIPKNFNFKYFRTIEYKNRALKENRLYKVRIRAKNLYHSKIWILKYQNWYLINFMTYQPLKKKIYNRKIRLKEISFYKNQIESDSLNYIYRSKFILFYFLNLTLSKYPYYKF